MTKTYKLEDLTISQMNTICKAARAYESYVYSNSFSSKIESTCSYCPLWLELNLFIKNSHRQQNVDIVRMCAKDCFHGKGKFCIDLDKLGKVEVEVNESIFTEPHRIIEP